MKFFALFTFATAVLAVPVEKRQTDLVAVTNQLSFDVTLETFISRRNARNPATLNWTSDGCTASPDNPLGFPFEPACFRHDFGYTNFRAQSRFTQSNKDKIDSKFLTDLKHQCEGEGTLGKITCKALAEVYYAAVRAFGGGDATPGKRDEVLMREYEEKLAVYKLLLAEAEKGNLM